MGSAGPWKEWRNKAIAPYGPEIDEIARSPEFQAHKAKLAAEKTRD